MKQDAAPLLVVRNVTKHYVAPRSWLAPTPPAVLAVDEVSFHVRSGETLALVGESGCGKTTIARIVARLTKADSGSVHFNGEDLLALDPRGMRLRRRDLQFVFQDPYASLNPRLRVKDIVGEPLANFEPRLSRQEREGRAMALLAKVGVGADLARCFPHELSGGQRQRVAIARALAPQPKLIVCDEPVSALDVSVQAQVINLLIDLQTDLGVAYLFVAHNLAVVRHVGHRVAVMRQGRIVETAECDALFDDPRHPYTRELLAASIVSRPGG